MNAFRGGRVFDAKHGGDQILLASAFWFLMWRQLAVVSLSGSLLKRWITGPIFPLFWPVDNLEKGFSLKTFKAFRLSFGYTEKGLMTLYP